MSYTIDLYRRQIKVQKNAASFMAFVTLFPQIVAGPIVRYEDIQNEIDDRTITEKMIGDGISRFIVGLGKKVLIANNIGLLWTEIKAMDYGEISAVTAWLGILAFTFQIYFDFSGYSDMAIGLGKMMGFHFPENFNYPYMSHSVAEFWRRWHITLGDWFKSYIYFPMGGSRKGLPRTIINLLVVWTITGIWHGASWNFMLWGTYFGILIVIERLFLGKVLEKIPALAVHVHYGGVRLGNVRRGGSRDCQLRQRFRADMDVHFGDVRRKRCVHRRHRNELYRKLWYYFCSVHFRQLRCAQDLRGVYPQKGSDLGAVWIPGCGYGHHARFSGVPFHLELQSVPVL